MTFEQIEMSRFDSLPPKVREALRNHPYNIECNELTGSERKMLRDLASSARAWASDRQAAELLGTD